MNELNIYADFNYRKILKNANLLFDGHYFHCHAKTIFAPKNGTFSISLNKWNIRICYWNEHTEQGAKAKALIIKFIEENFSNKTIGVTCFGSCDILNELDSVKTMQIK